MRLTCFYCQKSVSTEVSDETIIRAILECPECIEKRPDLEETLFALEKLVVFVKELCEEIKVSKHYPSIDRAEKVLAKRK